MKTTVSPRGDIPTELADRITQIAQPIHQGDVFKRTDYWILCAMGLVIPAILMFAGWLL